MVKSILQVLALVAGLLLMAPIAAASNGRAEYERGAKYFQAGEYEAALPYFQKAYELSGRRPAAVFALAQCERSLKMYEQSILHFEEYLESDPDDATDVKETIVLLGELLAKRRAEERREAEALRAERAAEEAERQRLEEERLRAEAEREAAAERARLAEARAREAAEARRRAELELEKMKLSGQVPPAPPPGGTTPTATARAPSEPDEGDGVLSSPWFWVVAGAVAAGGAVTAGVLLTRDNSAAPYGGTTGVVLRP